MLENNMQRTGDFSRTLHNQAKLGAYYTDVQHCAAMSNFLSFPEEDVVCLEPSIGNGEAIKACIGKVAGDNKHIFGVELKSNVSSETRNDPCIEQVLTADFLHGTTISPSSVSFIFSNPPYMTEDGLRTEELFFDKFHNILKPKGVLVFVIPYYIFSMKSFFVKMWNRYEFKHVYKFHEGEYEKWHQIVLIGVKRETKVSLLKDERDRLLTEVYAEDVLNRLPFDYDGEKVAVMPSKVDGMKTFTTVLFPAEECLESMREGTLKVTVSQFFDAMGKKITPESYDGGKDKVCPIHPNKDSMYLLGVCGAGAGLCGSEEEGNLHLQRGVVKIVAEQELEDKDGTDGVVVETTRASVTYKVIEADGRISSLA